MYALLPVIPIYCKTIGSYDFDPCSDMMEMDLGGWGLLLWIMVIGVPMSMIIFSNFGIWKMAIRSTKSVSNSL